MRTTWCFLLAVPSLVAAAGIDNLRVIQHQGNYSKVMVFTLNADIEHLLLFPSSESKYPYRIEAWSDASVSFPIMVVVRQEKQVVSWEVPFTVETSKTEGQVHFQNTSRTLCHNNMPEINKMMKIDRTFHVTLLQSFIVTLSTSARKNVTISIKVEEECDFYLKNGGKYTIVISPSQTKYYYYSFSKDINNVIIQVTSNDDVCLMVSIQDTDCPVFDLDDNITYEGKYQTINRKGGMHIRREEYPGGFFLVFVSKADNYECTKKHSLVPDNRISIVDFKIIKGNCCVDYVRASLIIMGAIGGFYVVAIVMVVVFTNCGTLSKFIKNRSRDEIVSEENNLLSEPVVLNEAERLNLIREKKLTVNLLARAPNTNKTRSYNYLWHILSIAVFYGIPVVQLASTYQRVVNRTGNQDMCYYNFLCANPVWGLSDFNHVFSNVCYVCMGILFLCAVLYRYSKIPNTTTGIPVHYGLYYAMGIALIIEGILSACYHICPTQSNYQFDTSFMYVMAVLCSVKLYQNRHPDINATAYATFTVLGLGIFLAMVGILDGSLQIWIIFFVSYTLLCIYISFKMYFFSFVCDGYVQLKESMRESSNKLAALAPIKKGRFYLLVIANIINYATLITGLCFYNLGVSDFGTFLLGLLMGNSILYAVFYTGMKLAHGERICFEAIIYGCLGLAAWAAATTFFLDKATLWAVTPAESRQRNQECILMDFYDKHDVWHLLSGPALYFTFMFLLCLDDDLVDKERSEITVF